MRARMTLNQICVLLLILCTSCECLINSGDSYCGKSSKRLKEMSRTKCVAGRSYFARFDRMPILTQYIPASKLAQPYVYPWLAKVHTTYAGKTFLCTGTLINDRYIITAQHCVLPPIEPHDITINLGSESDYQDTVNMIDHHPRSTPTSIKTQPVTVIRHPGYDYTNHLTSLNDLALIKIGPIAYSKTIYPIQLPTLFDKYKYRARSILVESCGWKLSAPFQLPYREVFFKNTLRTLEAQICSGFNAYYSLFINPGNICAVSAKNAGDVICHGNSGAPLMLENTKRIFNVSVLLGIETWSWPKNNMGCTLEGSPVVYVKIVDKLQWIYDNTKDALYCRY